MQIILLREKRGRAHSQRLPGAAAAALVALVVAGLIGSGVVATRIVAGEGFGTNLISTWQGRVRAQREEVEALKKESRDELEAVGRRLATMQARMLRIEALGERVTEVAKLDRGEFDFGARPAVGGPESPNEVEPTTPEFFLAMDQLENHLRVRETELELLESMLATRKYREDVALTGRPIERGWMSSEFGRRVDPITGRIAWHPGIDFAGNLGDPVVAVAAGVVVFSGDHLGYGRMIEIEHGGGYSTRYAHQETMLVSSGDVVKKGQVIGLIGSTGRSTGPHVHFEVLKDGHQVDPSQYVARMNES
jgi:murein DD-endopeptidase MepM/ murein hydrolase activator NlpD